MYRPLPCLSFVRHRSLCAPSERAAPRRAVGCLTRRRALAPRRNCIETATLSSLGVRAQSVRFARQIGPTVARSPRLDTGRPALGVRAVRGPCHVSGASITGVKYETFNSSGFSPGQDTPQGGVTIELINTATNAVTMTTTAPGTGVFTFNNVADGIYHVQSGSPPASRKARDRRSTPLTSPAARCFCRARNRPRPGR